MDAKDKLRHQISDAAGNVFYTHIAHWEYVNRLKCKEKRIKFALIILTALSTGGFLTSVISDATWLNWAGGLSSAIALGLNLYTLNFKLADDIKDHTAAANELWDVREGYKTLMVDFDDMPIEQARQARDKLTERVSDINKKYPGTDKKSFARAQKRIGDYTFTDGESERLVQSGECKK